MITPDNFAPILAALAWPCVLLVIVLTFREHIAKLLERLEEAAFPGGKASFRPVRYGDASVDKEQLASGSETKPVVRPEVPGKQGIKWENSGNLFWVGYDLMSAVDFLLRGAPRDMILHSFRQSLHHVRSLCIWAPSVEGRLAEFYAEAERTPELGWTRAKRDSYPKELG